MMLFGLFHHAVQINLRVAQTRRAAVQVIHSLDQMIREMPQLADLQEKWRK